MKKIVLVGILILTVFVSSGCDKKKVLTCTKSEDTTGMKIETTVTTDFVGNSISTIKMNMDVKLDSTYVKYKDTIQKSLEQQYSSYKNTKGITYKASNSDDVINLNFVIDNKKITDDDRKKLNMVGNENYDVNKKTMENQGYSCK